MLLSVAGGLLGLGLGYAGVRALTAFGLEATPQGTQVTIDATVIAFTFGLSIVLAVLIGLIPVIGLRQMNLSQSFREEGRSGTASRGARVTRRVLVTAQIAFAFMLLIGAGLLLASFQRVLGVRPGFDASHVMTGIVSLPGDALQGRREPDGVLEPADGAGPRAAGRAGGRHRQQHPARRQLQRQRHPRRGLRDGAGRVADLPLQRRRSRPATSRRCRSRSKRGRLFTASDDERAAKVADRRRAAGASASGRDRIRSAGGCGSPTIPRIYSKGPGPKTRYFTVVGVVGNVRTTGLTEKEPVGTYYFPVAQDAGRGMTLVTRTAGEPSAIVGSIRQVVTSIDPELPFFAVKPMQQRVDESLVSRRTPMLLASVFGGIALFLAAVGIYGVLAFQVAQRRKEIGIRMALGSDGRRIFGLIVTEGLWLLALGVGVGLAGAFGIRRAMETQLFGVQAMDPTVIALVTGVLGVVAFLACAVPAHRASRIDPLIALNDQMRRATASRTAQRREALRSLRVGDSRTARTRYTHVWRSKLYSWTPAASSSIPTGGACRTRWRSSACRSRPRR